MTLLGELIRFGMVGIIASLTHFSIVVLLVQYHILSPLTANIAAFLTAFQVSYWGHREWTFRSVCRHRVAFPRLFGIQIVLLIVSEGLFYLLLKIPIPYQMALFFVIITMPALSFFSSQRWVFK